MNASTPLPVIGAHVSVRGGIHNAIDNALAIGAAAYQIHPTTPQQWRRVEFADDVVSTYREKFAAAQLQGQFLHAIYLINLATPSDTLLAQSIGSLTYYMDVAHQLGADGVVFHPGSHKGAGFDTALPQVAQAMRDVLDRTDSSAKLLVENSAGQGGCVGCSLDEVGHILEQVDSDRVGVCLDTAHIFASGYDIRTAEGVATTLADFERCIGLDRLAVVHANDSRTVLSSNVDRHANIGDGEIGKAAFEFLLADERMRRVPWILEVPGIEKTGPDLENINRLRVCAGMAPTQPLLSV